jgi:hypothetical protein
MTVKGVYTGEAWEDIGATLIARFASIFGTGAASPDTTEGNLILQADVSSISVKVFDIDGTQISTTLAPSAASTIFDTLQTSGTWGNLSRGGNFRYSVPGDYFPTGGTTNRVEVVVTLTDGHKLPAVWTLAVVELKGS